ncbi:hypothetical protein AALP_AAs51090U000100 [Arabis alpina]|uniref:Uncharacterized protein n=1 Tax=Arabis alpina TaxID=50452 RepID=A0A087FX18_ARAAL|nr:hypothetical protein AALP_AAs51090U000100 [Arabis alpina]
MIKSRFFKYKGFTSDLEEISRKVFSSHFGQLSIIFLWLSGMYFRILKILWSEMMIVSSSSGSLGFRPLQFLNRSTSSSSEIENPIQGAFLHC